VAVAREEAVEERLHAAGALERRGADREVAAVGELEAEVAAQARDRREVAGPLEREVERPEAAARAAGDGAPARLRECPVAPLDLGQHLVDDVVFVAAERARVHVLRAAEPRARVGQDEERGRAALGKEAGEPLVEPLVPAAAVEQRRPEPRERREHDDDRVAARARLVVGRDDDHDLALVGVALRIAAQRGAAQHEALDADGRRHHRRARLTAA
jgi:hypothetical protein